MRSFHSRVLLATLTFLVILSVFSVPARGEMEVEVVQIFFRDAVRLAEELSKFSSEGGRVVADPKSNLIVIHDSLRVIATMKEKIRTLDARPLRVKIVTGFLEKEKVAGPGPGAHWFFTDPNWSQGSLPPDLDLFSGLGIVSPGAAKRMETFNRQLVMLEGNSEGTVHISASVPDPVWFLQYCVSWGYIDSRAQFRSVGSSFGISANEGEGGQIEVRLVPRLTRADGGSDIPMENARLFLLVEKGKTVVVAGNVEDEGSFGRRFMSLPDRSGVPKEMVMVLTVTAE